jgi:erythromycin esterase-like protein
MGLPPQPIPHYITQADPNVEMYFAYEANQYIDALKGQLSAAHAEIARRTRHAAAINDQLIAKCNEVRELQAKLAQMEKEKENAE